MHWHMAYDGCTRRLWGSHNLDISHRLLTEISSLNYFCSEDWFEKALRRVMSCERTGKLQYVSMDTVYTVERTLCTILVGGGLKYR